MTIKGAKKVTKRSWSLDRFNKSVALRCKVAGVKPVKGKIATCYEEGVTVADTVRVLQKA